MMLSKSHCQIEHTILGGGFTYFLFSPCLGKIPILTSIFLIGWNHQPEYIFIHLEKGPVLSAMLASQKATTSSPAHPSWFFAALLKMMTFDTFAKVFFFWTHFLETKPLMEDSHFFTWLQNQKCKIGNLPWHGEMTLIFSMMEMNSCLSTSYNKKLPDLFGHLGSPPHQSLWVDVPVPINQLKTETCEVKRQ